MGAWKIPAAVDNALYELDFWLWSKQQADRLRELRPAGIDWEHLAEEIESLGKRDRRELFSRIEILVMHLLKWETRKRLGGEPSQSWISTIRTQRSELAMVLDDSPSLRRLIPDAVRGRYPGAVRKAALEMHVGVKHFPEECPFSPEQVMDTDWLP